MLAGMKTRRSNGIEKRGQALAKRIKAHRDYTVAYQGIGVIGPEESTDISTASPNIDNPDASGLVAAKPELGEYKAVYVQNDAGVGLFSDEVVVNCAP